MTQGRNGTWSRRAFEVPDARLVQAEREVYAQYGVDVSIDAKAKSLLRFGETEDEYLNYYRNLAGIPAEVEQDGGKTMSIEITFKSELEGKILKADDEQRLVYGWASVITEKGERVVDRQGDVIEADTLVKAVNDFMEHVRVGKAMHTGEQVGVVVHSLPITKEIGDALGIHSDREGWVVAYKVYDDAVWDMVKSGELAAFSIGGRAVKVDLNEN